MPQFITAAAPNYDAPGVNTNQEAYRLQLKMFLTLLAQQRHLPALKQLLHLYTVRSRQPRKLSVLPPPSTCVRCVFTAPSCASPCF